MDLESVIQSEASQKKKNKYHILTPLVAQLVKNPIAMQETLVQSRGREDPLEKG